MVDDPYLKEVEQEEKFKHLLMQLDADIARFENLSEDAKNSPLTERDMYQLKLWIRSVFE